MAERRDTELAGLDRQELLDHYARMVQEASRDALTGLLNRGALEREIEKRLAGKPKQDSCALFIVDLDNFKSVNDNLGHQTGDVVLQKMAALLSGLFRATDVVGRLGGDEFVIFLCGRLTEDMVRTKAQNICDQALFLMGESADLAVTASVGVHLSEDGDATFQALYRSADRALYRAKREGKQRYHLKRDVHAAPLPSVSEARPVSAVRLRTLLNHLETGVAVLSVERPIRILYENERMEQMLGRVRAAADESFALDAVHPDDRENLEHVLMERVLGRNETVSLVVRIIHKSSQVMWWRIHAVQMEIEEQQRTILITAVDVSDLKGRENVLSMEQSGVWELDLSTRSFRLVTGQEAFPGCDDAAVDFPEGLLERGWVEPDSHDAFREFAQEIFNGRTEGYANFKVLFGAPGRYGWACFTYRTVYDADGKPAWIAGMIERIAPADPVREQSTKETALPPELMSCLILQARGNLSSDTLERCWREGREELGKPDRLRCSDLLDREARCRYPEKDRPLPNLTREALLLLAQEHKNGWWVHEYFRADATGRMHRVCCVLNLYCDSQSGEAQMAIWINRMDSRAAWEHTAGERIYKDPISKFYTLSTARAMTMQLLKERSQKLCAMVLVDIGGLPRLYAQDNAGMERKWRAIMAALALAMGADCIPGQLQSNTFSFFYPEVPSEDALRRRMDRALVFLRGVIGDAVDCGVLRFLVCGVCRPQNQTSYNYLARKALALRSCWANTTADRVDFAQDDSEELRPTLANSGESDRIRVVPLPDRPLSEREQAAANRCYVAMFRADSLADTARCVLRTLGEYYEADRVYFLDLVENNEVVTMPAEWTAPDKKSIQEAVSGAPASSYPLVEQCARSGKPIFLSRTIQPGNGEQLWRFAIFPVWDRDRCRSFLCVENSRKVISDGALAAQLTECLMQQSRKFFQPPGYTVQGNRIPEGEIPDHNAFLQAIYTYTSDVYTSLGVVCVDVPRLGAIRNTHGAQYTQKLMWFLAQTLMDVFGRTRLYRTWNAEYVALCPNVDRTTFLSSCARVRSLLVQRYAGDFRMGSAWADKFFAGKALTEDARVAMQCDLPAPSGVELNQLPRPLYDAASVRRMLAAGRFVVVLQPIFAVETGALAGAEALVRCLDARDMPIPPKVFLDLLEQEGAVRDLDLYVLDRVLHMLDQWRTAGLNTVPLHVNFARATLLDARAPASVLAIGSRYGEITPGTLVVELDEPVLDGDMQAAQRAMEAFRTHGLAFSLDNFGKKHTDAAELAGFEAVSLDRDLIDQLPNSERSRAVVRGALEACPAQCIAEGVQTQEQLQLLRQMGVPYAQGYFLGHPAPPEQFREKWLRAGK